jgi:hypothetical protein
LATHRPFRHVGTTHPLFGCTHEPTMVASSIRVARLPNSVITQLVIVSCVLPTPYDELNVKTPSHGIQQSQHSH